MKKSYIILFLALSGLFYGQTNLVPNPSFEDYYNCPVYRGEVYNTKYWFTAGGSSDYFNACGNNEVDVPKNIFGFQYAATGNAYAGFAAGFTHTPYSNARELIAVPLTSTLIIGQKYFVSFKVCGAYSPGQGMFFNNNLGALFTKYKLDSANYIGPNKWHISNNTIINDTLNWIRIKGSFIADSSYTYLTIGNLKDSSTIAIDSSITFQENIFPLYSYYYCDDVCVSIDSLFSYNFNSVGIKKQNLNLDFSIYPNPTSDYLLIKLTDSKEITVKVVDRFGKILLIKTDFSEVKIDVNDLSDGVYFLEVFYDNKKYYDKVIVRH